MKPATGPSTLGERLRHAMRLAGIDNAELAEAAGVHVKTISKWLGDKQAPDSGPLERAAARVGVTTQYLRHGDSHGGAAGVVGLRRAYGDIVERQTTSVVIPAEIPQSARALIRRFEAEATEIGASEEEIEFIRRVLTMPETFALHGNEEMRVLVGLEALMRGLKTWLLELHGAR